MKVKTLTIKQEAFCQAYVRLGDKSAAYRSAYSTSNMKVESINNKAYMLSEKVEIRARIEVLRKEVSERNKITIDDLVQSLSGMVRFDPADIYKQDGTLKSIHDIPKEARLMISELTIDELKGYAKGDSVIIGQTKKIKLFDKLGAIEKLMKHLGGYEKDNGQKQPITNIDLSDGFTDEKRARLEQLLSKATKALEKK